MPVRCAIAGMTVVIVLALPAGATAKQGGPLDPLALRQCIQERSDLGKRAFRKKYGAKRTMRNCVKRTRGKVGSVVGAASGRCQQELSQTGPLDFLELYGEDPTDSLESAMSECVAEAVDELLHPEDHVDELGDEADDE